MPLSLSLSFTVYTTPSFTTCSSGSRSDSSGYRSTQVWNWSTNRARRGSALIYLGLSGFISFVRRRATPSTTSASTVQWLFPRLRIEEPDSLFQLSFALFLSYDGNQGLSASSPSVRGKKAPQVVLSQREEEKSKRTYALQVGVSHVVYVEPWSCVQLSSITMRGKTRREKESNVLDG